MCHDASLTNFSVGLQPYNRSPWDPMESSWEGSG